MWPGVTHWHRGLIVRGRTQRGDRSLQCGFSRHISTRSQLDTAVVVWPLMVVIVLTDYGMVPPRLRGGVRLTADFCQSVKYLWIPWVFQRNLGCPGSHIWRPCPTPARESWNDSAHCLVCTCDQWRLAVGETSSSTSIEERLIYIFISYSRLCTILNHGAK